MPSKIPTGTTLELGSKLRVVAAVGVARARDGGDRVGRGVVSGC